MTVTGPVPWIPAALRAVLLADAAFNTACGGRLSSRLPGSITFCGQLRTAGNNAIDGGGVAYSVLAQLDGWCADPEVSGVADPEVKAWEIAAAGAVVLGRLRNISYQNMTYSGRLVEGPLPDVDTSRGESTPLYRAIVRVELAVQVFAVP